MQTSPRPTSSASLVDSRPQFPLPGAQPIEDWIDGLDEVAHLLDRAAAELVAAACARHPRAREAHWELAAAYRARADLVARSAHAARAGAVTGGENRG